MKLLKKSIYIRYLIAKLSKLVKSACWPPQIRFYIGFFENQKVPETGMQATFSVELYDKKVRLKTAHISLPGCV